MNHMVILETLIMSILCQYRRHITLETHFVGDTPAAGESVKWRRGEMVTGRKGETEKMRIALCVRRKALSMLRAASCATAL
ncbi:hypothetical protein AYK25_08850 [Thermoplasmatales archaeon SM1-50]|nr:MAG: hypothetical protein AYK25_08850 [Thermoplasmatales archaeon SM1-50]